METSIFESKSGVEYQLVNHSGLEIEVRLNGKTVGSIVFREVGLPHPPYVLYHITNLGLDKCKKQGVGRACLLFHKEIYSAPLSAGRDDGILEDDGSHLTGDGVGFIAKMRQEGIVCPKTE